MEITTEQRLVRAIKDKWVLRTKEEGRATHYLPFKEGENYAVIQKGVVVESLHSTDLYKRLLSYLLSRKEIRGVPQTVLYGGR